MRLLLPLFIFLIAISCKPSQSPADDEFTHQNQLISISEVSWSSDYTEVEFTLTNKSEYLHYPLVVIDVTFFGNTDVLGQLEMKVYPNPIIGPGEQQRITKEVSPPSSVQTAKEGVKSSWALKPNEVEKFDRMVRTGPGY